MLVSRLHYIFKKKLCHDIKVDKPYGGWWDPTLIMCVVLEHECRDKREILIIPF